MSFKVTLQPSGRVFSVESAEPVLTQGLRQGIGMPYGCRMGTCSSCRGRILSGDVDLGNAHLAYLPQAQRDQGYALLCQATAHSDLTIELEELPPIPPSQVTPAILKSATQLAPDVIEMKFRLPLHLNLRFLAGQYVDIILPTGERRSYSIANPPNIEGVIDFEFHVRRMPGGLFTDQLFAGLPPRAKMEIEGPLGTFFLRESDKPIIMLASGTGYAPIRSILLDTLPKHTGRRITLYWGGRIAPDLYMMEEAKELARAYEHFEFVPVLSEARAADAWMGRTGFVHRAVMEDHPDLSGHQVYACGVPVMVDAARRDFTRICELPSSEFFADSFVSAADTAVAGGIIP